MSDTGIFVRHLVVRNAILLIASRSIVLLLNIYLFKSIHNGNRMGDACSYSTARVFFISSSTNFRYVFSQILKVQTTKYFIGGRVSHKLLLP